VYPAVDDETGVCSRRLVIDGLVLPKRGDGRRHDAAKRQRVGGAGIVIRHASYSIGDGQKRLPPRLARRLE